MKRIQIDIAMTPDGKYSVQWKYEDGSLSWESFDTSDARRKIMKLNTIINAAAKGETVFRFDKNDDDYLYDVD
jgi:hypothetical protein